MKLLFLDFETQSDDAKTTYPTEVGCTGFAAKSIGFGFEHWEKDLTFSSLIYDPTYPKQTEEIVEITGIDDDLLVQHGQKPTTVFEQIFPMIASADYVLAHNAAFDRGVYESSAKRLGLPVAQPKKGWICTIQDVPWARKYKCKKLSHLAFDHGIQSDVGSLHRADYDTDLLARLILGHCLMTDVIAYRDTPWLYLRAKVLGPWQGPGGDGGIQTGQAKKLGFAWEKIWGTEIVFPKMWVKRIKQTELEKEKARCPFQLSRLTFDGDVQ